MSEDHVSVKDMYEVAPPETHKPWGQWDCLQALVNFKGK